MAASALREEWWVIPEGSLGKLVNALGPGITLNLYTVEQSATQPPGAAAGPFATQAQAQAQATAFNEAGQNVPTLPNIAKSAVGFGQNTGGGNPNQFDWQNVMLRVGEVLVGLVLIAVGINSMLKGRPLAVITNAAGAVGKVVP